MRTLLLLLCAGSLLLACSSSDGSSKSDASVAEGDGDGDGTGGTPSRPRVDAGDVLGDAVPPCDPWDPDACPAAQKCDVVARRSPTAESFQVYTGCVEDRGGRLEDDPCQPWNAFRTPYETAGLFDEVHVDPCDQGLLCAPDREILGLNTCQPSCQSGRFAGNGFPAIGCNADQFCETSDAANPDPYREVCRDAASCDPRDTSACESGLTCVLRLVGAGVTLATECLPLPAEPIADGEACAFNNDCNPGSLCWGPVRVPPGDWTESNVMCRPVCDPQADDDAGVGCPDGTTCVAFEDSGLNLDIIPVVFGQCE